MQLNFYIQLILLFVVNLIFTFTGIVSNTLVIASFWKSSQLRKKLCHFMIMVLSCSDLVVVVTNHPGILLCIIFWLRGDYDLLLKWAFYMDFVTIFYAYSFLLLFVMSIEQYLGAYYPIFHRTSVTRRRLLTLLGILLIFHTALHVICTNDMIISSTPVITTYIVTVFLPLVYLNFKLFKISREVRRRKVASPETRTTINLKSISTCLLVVGLVVVSSTSASADIVFDIITENNQPSSVRLSFIWSVTIWNTNCTLNSLIFFWKNKVLRTEGVKMLKTLKDRLLGFT